MVQWSALVIQCNVHQCSVRVIQCNSVQCSVRVTQCNVVQCSVQAIQCNAVQCSARVTVQCGAVLCTRHTVQYGNTVPLLSLCRPCNLDLHESCSAVSSALCCAVARAAVACILDNTRCDQCVVGSPAVMRMIHNPLLISELSNRYPLQGPSDARQVLIPLTLAVVTTLTEVMQCPAGVMTILAVVIQCPAGVMIQCLAGVMIQCPAGVMTTLPVVIQCAAGVMTTLAVVIQCPAGVMTFMTVMATVTGVA